MVFTAALTRRVMDRFMSDISNEIKSLKLGVSSKADQSHTAEALEDLQQDVDKCKDQGARQQLQDKRLEAIQDALGQKAEHESLEALRHGIATDSARLQLLYDHLNKFEPVLARAVSSEPNKAATGDLASHVVAAIEKLSRVVDKGEKNSMEIESIRGILATVGDADSLKEIAKETSAESLAEVWQRMESVWYKCEKTTAGVGAMAETMLRVAMPEKEWMKLVTNEGSQQSLLAHLGDQYADLPNRATELIVGMANGEFPVEQERYFDHKASGAEVRRELLQVRKEADDRGKEAEKLLSDTEALEVKLAELVSTQCNKKEVNEIIKDST